MKGATLSPAKGLSAVNGRGEIQGCVKILRDDMHGIPPKEDVTLSHSRHLPRMGKDSHLSAIRASVVRQEDDVLRGLG